MLAAPEPALARFCTGCGIGQDVDTEVRAKDR